MTNYYTYTFESYEELVEWINAHKDDKRKVHYYGFLENFDGTLYDIDDIGHDACPEWFDDGATVEIYKVIEE